MSVAPPYGSNTWELYNIAEDPGETRNLAADKPELLETLKAAWEQWADETGVIWRKN